MVWPHSEHLGQNENFAILFLQHSQHCQTFWVPCAVEQMRFNLTACAYGMLSLPLLGLIKFLVERGYQQSSVRKQIQRAQVLDHNELLAPRPPRATDRIPLTVTYHLGLPKIGGILWELHPLLQMSERCKQAVTDVPMMDFCRPKNLQDYLVRTRLPSLDQITVIRMIEGHLSVLVADAMFVIMSLRVLAFLATPQAVVIL